jgi:LuxR family maltose regulon positive regulatory protein
VEGARAWLNLDDGDRDPSRFWQAFVAAVRTTVPGFGDDVEVAWQPHATEREPLERVVAALGDLEGPLVVVVDDFHLVGPTVQAQVGFVLGREPTRLQLVISSRIEPAVGLHRLRLAGGVRELREADLRFGRTAARRMLQRLGARLSDDAVDLIVDRTEGWAAGLQLAALAVRDAPDPALVIAGLSGTDRVVGHYLWSEVFELQGPDVRRFLLDTCVVDELTPSLAAALSPGNPVSLLDIEKANLLLRRTDPEGRSFRYHQLFLDLLRFRLRGTGLDHEAELHGRAAAWYAAEGDIVGHFLHRWRAGDRAGALRSVQHRVLDVRFDAIGPMDDLERSLSTDDILAAPGPAVSLATALMTSGQVTISERLAQRVELAAGSVLAADEASQLRALRAMNALVVGDSVGAAALRGRQVAVDPAPGSPSATWTDLARCAFARGSVWEHRLTDAAEVLEGLPSVNSSPLVRMEVAATRAQLELAAGRLDASEAVATSALAEVGADGSATLTDGLLPQAILGCVLLQRGDLRASEPVLRRVGDTDSRFRVPAVVLANVGLARLYAATGRHSAAEEAIDRAYHIVLARPPRSGMLDHIRFHHARFLIRTDRLDEAEAVRHEIGRDDLAQLVAVDLESARGVGEAAAGALDRLLRVRSDLVGDRLAVAVARLRVQKLRGFEAGAAAEEVADLAVSSGHLLPLAEAGVGVLAAVQRSARRLPRTPAVEALMRLRPTLPPRRSSSDHDLEDLTDRERTVLQYLTTSLSYREIASELHISPNTLKTHVRNLGQKLDAGSRVELVERAAALGTI